MLTKTLCKEVPYNLFSSLVFSICMTKWCLLMDILQCYCQLLFSQSCSNQQKYSKHFSENLTSEFNRVQLLLVEQLVHSTIFQEAAIAISAILDSACFIVLTKPARTKQQSNKILFKVGCDLTVKQKWLTVTGVPKRRPDRIQNI